MTATATQDATAVPRRNETPERRCIVTREAGPRDGMLRFVVGPDNAVVPDLAERLPGRGMWVTARRDVLERAVAKNMFARAAKAGVKPAADLPETVAGLLARRCIELLALANRAGLAVAGYEKAAAALRGGKAALLLTAADATGQDAAALRRSAGDKAAPAVLTAAEQGQVFGREASVNVAVRPGALTGQLRRELYRLAGFRQTAAESGANMPRQVNG